MRFILPCCLGIDTSNYTTSAAVCDSDKGIVASEKIPLPVKQGELGLRQSDAVFHHTVNLPEILNKLSANNLFNIDIFSASYAPTDAENSYMPCFLAGAGLAKSLAAFSGLPYFENSHQAGHIAAALYSAGRLDLLKQKFLALHVSGGTTEILLVSPEGKNIIKAQKIAGTLDLKAGQAIDRLGAGMGLPFPAGPELDRLSRKSAKSFKIKPYLKNGDFSLSEIENKCAEMLQKDAPEEDIARFCFLYIAETLCMSLDYIFNNIGNMPILCAGGVMSNTIIREIFLEEYPSALFATPEFSSDNAAGTAILGSLKLRVES